MCNYTHTYYMAKQIPVVQLYARQIRTFGENKNLQATDERSYVTPLMFQMVPRTINILNRLYVDRWNLENAIRSSMSLLSKGNVAQIKRGVETVLRKRRIAG